MKKILTALVNTNLETVMRNMPWYIFAVSAVVLIFPVLLHLFSFKVTEADGVGIVGTVWVVLAAAYWVYARRTESANNQNITTINNLQVQLQALSNVYEGTLAQLDKKTLERLGVHFVRKERVIN